MARRPNGSACVERSLQRRRWCIATPYLPTSSRYDFHWFGEARRFAWINLLYLERYGHFYRPVIEIYFFVGQRLFGCAPLPFHLASLSIHLVNTATVFFFARRLAGSTRFAALSVFLFVLQPGYVQAVAWVAAITDLLGAFWYLLTLLLAPLASYRRESRGSTWPRWELSRHAC